MEDVIKLIEKSQASFELAKKECYELSLTDHNSATADSRYDLERIKLLFGLIETKIEVLLSMADSHVKMRHEEVSLYLARRGYPVPQIPTRKVPAIFPDAAPEAGTPHSEVDA